LLIAVGWLTLSPVAAEEIAPGIQLIPGKTAAGSQPDGNSIVLRAPEGLIIVDTGRHAEHTQRVLDLAKASRTPIRAIINSHWHLDHVGGNVLLRAAYPDIEVYATPAIDDALTGFLANYRKQLEGALTKAERNARTSENLRSEIALIDAGPKLKPTIVVSRSSTLNIAGRTLELNVERLAVTAGDIWVFDQESKVLIAGDLVTLPAPFLDTACPERWQSALETLSRKRFSRLIPGHGAPMDATAFNTYRTAFNELVACGADSKQTKSECIDGWMRNSSSLVPESDRAYARALIDYYVDNVFRGDAGKRAAACGR
jgi:glyoxylase-like metal-dependent hydrolase (beta-lactamase superfamily II)